MKIHPLTIAVLLLAGLMAGCAGGPRELSSGALVMDVGAPTGPALRLTGPGAAVVTGAVPTEVLFTGGQAVSQFEPVDAARAEAVADERLGTGQAVTVRGLAALPGGAGQIEKVTQFVRYDAFPGVLVTRTAYVNRGEGPVTIDSVYSQQYRLRTADMPTPDRPAFWSFQAASYPSRPDWVLPLQEGYYRYNYQGMNAPDYGGGVPVVDVWTPQGGLAVGHLATEPALVALPVGMVGAQEVEIRLVDPAARTLGAGERFDVVPAFVAAHEGDYFATLQTYAALMDALGVRTPDFPQTSYEPQWCAWGYGRNFDTKALFAALPKVKELGLQWATLDDGWQVAEGDWRPVASRFPRGEADMIAFVDSIHAAGLKAQLWWAPLAADPGSDLEREHPDWFILDEHGERQKVSWWDSYYLCPAHPEVRAHSQQLVRTFIDTWGYDGLKIDGHHLNAVAPCHNPAHNHPDPNASVRSLPGYWADVYNAAIEAKADAVVQLCPCGDAASFFNMPYTNQPVSSDPTSSWQIRTKGKTFKALMGPDTPYYGDHVELSDGGTDFASTVGIGGVVGTKFTWAPPAALAGARWMGEEEPRSLLLTDAREAHWKKWIGLYRRYDLAKGEYRGGLYDVGYDRPEAHVVAKADTLYYGFYADTWDGAVALRGLAPGTTYRVRDYVNERDLGTIAGPEGRIDVSFTDHLLIEAVPVR